MENILNGNSASDDTVKMLKILNSGGSVIFVGPSIHIGFGFPVKRESITFDGEPAVKIARTLSVGHKIFFTGEKLPMMIMARSERFIVCSRKLNRRHDADLLWHEVKMNAYCTFTQAYEGCKDFPVYSILDLQKNERAPDNYGAYFDYFNHSECRNAVKMLESGKLELSRRNKADLNIDYERTFKNSK